MALRPWAYTLSEVSEVSLVGLCVMVIPPPTDTYVASMYPVHVNPCPKLRCALKGFSYLNIFQQVDRQLVNQDLLAALLDFLSV